MIKKIVYQRFQNQIINYNKKFISSQKFIFLVIILLISIKYNIYSNQIDSNQTNNTKVDSLLINQNYSQPDKVARLLFPKYKVHIGAEVTNLVHFGFGFRITDITMLEINLATPIPNAFFIPVIGAFSLGTNILLFGNKKIIFNTQIPVWFGLNIDEEVIIFPTVNIGWFNSWAKGHHSENFMIRGGISYLFRFKYKYNNKLVPEHLFFNVGLQIGLGFD
jgi:hypothetical protein